ncbi:MAG: hypothetical protein QG656_2635 [Candidatus Hydrogenedentes bacterium]|nr:hypothetical protein [Candidatus Hydrogenedentota bacterium]
MKVLVTGGSGNVGRTVVSELLTAGHAVRVFDANPAANAEAEFVRGSITDPAAIEAAAEGVEAIVHLAAIPAPRPGIPGVDFMHVNVTGTFNVLEAAAKQGVQTMAMASSDSSLGFVFATHPHAPDYFPIDEAHPLRPQDPYGLSKLIDEELCKAATRKYGFKTRCLRFCWVWFDDTYPHRTAMMQGDPAPLARSLWGYVDVRDAAQACRLAVETPGDAAYDYYFITAADTYADKPTLDLIRTHYPGVTQVNEAYFDTPNKSVFDTSKARRLLGYAPRHNWRERE